MKKDDGSLITADRCQTRAVMVSRFPHRLVRVEANLATRHGFDKSLLLSTLACPGGSEFGSPGTTLTNVDSSALAFRRGAYIPFKKKNRSLGMAFQRHGILPQEAFPVTKFASTWTSQGGKQKHFFSTRSLVAKFASTWASQGGKQNSTGLYLAAALRLKATVP